MGSPLVTRDLLMGHEPGGGPLSPALSPRCGARGPETERDTRFLASGLYTGDLLAGFEPRGTAVTHRR